MIRYRLFVLAGSLLLLAQAPASAQGVSTSTGGLEAGLTWATFSDLDAVVGSVDHQQTFLLGIYGVSMVTNSVGVQSELLYARKGAVTRDPSGTLALTQTFDYLEIPVLLRIGSAVGRGPGAFVLFGTSFDVLLRARETFTGSAEEDIKSQVTGSDFGLIAGAGLRAGHLEFEGRYEAGLKNLVPASQRHPGDPEPKNRTISLSGRIRF